MCPCVNRSAVLKKSSGTCAFSAAAKKPLQSLGRREMLTSPVTGSLRMNTYWVSKLKAAGSRTAWLQPLVKSMTVCDMVNLFVGSLSLCVLLFGLAGMSVRAWLSQLWSLDDCCGLKKRRSCCKWTQNTSP